MECIEWGSSVFQEDLGRPALRHGTSQRLTNNILQLEVLQRLERRSWKFSIGLVSRIHRLLIRNIDSTRCETEVQKTKENCCTNLLMSIVRWSVSMVARLTIGAVLRLIRTVWNWLLGIRMWTTGHPYVHYWAMHAKSASSNETIIKGRYSTPVTTVQERRISRTNANSRQVWRNELTWGRIPSSWLLNCLLKEILVRELDRKELLFCLLIMGILMLCKISGQLVTSRLIWESYGSRCNVLYWTGNNFSI